MEKRDITFEVIDAKGTACHQAFANGKKIAEWFENDDSFFDAENSLCINCHCEEFFVAYFLKDKGLTFEVKETSDTGVWRCRAYENSFLLATWFSYNDWFWLEEKRINCKTVEEFKAFFSKEAISEVSEVWFMYVIATSGGKRTLIRNFDLTETQVKKLAHDLAVAAKPLSLTTYHDEVIWVGEHDIISLSK